MRLISLLSMMLSYSLFAPILFPIRFYVHGIHHKDYHGPKMVNEDVGGTLAYVVWLVVTAVLSLPAFLGIVFITIAIAAFGLRKANGNHVFLFFLPFVTLFLAIFLIGRNK